MYSAFEQNNNCNFKIKELPSKENVSLSPIFNQDVVFNTQEFKKKNIRYKLLSLVSLPYFITRSFKKSTTTTTTTTTTTNTIKKKQLNTHTHPHPPRPPTNTPTQT